MKLIDPFASAVLGGEAVALALAETVAPRRARTETRARRWPRNLAMSALSAIVERAVVVPAMLAVARRTGVRRASVPKAMAAFVMLDWGIYLWHRANHEVPALWRFHATHHADPDLDTSTAARFHPVEVLLSTLARCAAVAVSRARPATVLAYELTMQACTLFHHTNVELPRTLDRLLRMVVVTPRMHGIHHARVDSLQNANWGTVSTVWDRLHGTLRLDADERVTGVGLASRLRPSSASA